MEQVLQSKKSLFVEKGLKLFNRLLDYRYLIAGLIFIMMLLGKISGSSLTMWDQYVTEYQPGTEKSAVLFGKARPVRSDEWLVQTPYSLSQTQSGFKQENPNITADGQNMVVGYNSPAFNLATLAKPFSWGYFLGKDYGPSWYWGIKLLGFMLFSFEFALILTRRNRYLASLFSLWFSFSAAIQWWFVSPVGDLAFYMLGLLVSIYYFFYYHEDHKKQIGLAFLATLMASGFVLDLYPALQVPLGYLILLMLIGFYFEFKEKVKLRKSDIGLIGGAVILTGLIVGVSLLTSKDALVATLHSAYPGKRISLGGKLPKSDIFLYLLNWKMPFVDVPYTNNSELSSFYHLFFVILPIAPLFLFKKGKSLSYGKLLFWYCSANLIWMCLKFPKLFAKVTLLSYVPSQRALISFGMGAMFLSIWFLAYLWENKRLTWPWITVGLGGNLLVYLYVMYRGNLRLYVSKWEILLTLAVAACLILLLFYHFKKLFAFGLLVCVMITGLTVNPVIRGTGTVYHKKLAYKITALKKAHPNALWSGERLMYGYLPMFGVHTFNSIAFTPDVKSWQKLDPHHKNTFVYNRYAHTNVEFVPEDTKEPLFTLIQKDAILIHLRPSDLKTCGISYVVAYKQLTPFATSEVKFKKLYGPDLNGAYIYQVID